MSKSPLLIAIMGQTGSGKSFVAEELAQTLNAQLINADAFQVYRGFDIGTNKPTQLKKYELLNILNPEEQFGLGAWIKLVIPLLEKIYEENRNAILVGGTGLYIRALLEEYQDIHAMPSQKIREEIEEQLEIEGLDSLIKELTTLDPQAASDIDLTHPLRIKRALEKAKTKSEPLKIKLPPFQKFKFSLDLPLEQMDEAIKSRTEAMLNKGWIEEVREILKKGVPANAPAFRAIGYHSIIDYLEGHLNREELVETVYLQTRQYAKRQRTWLRSEPNLYSIKIQEVSQIELLQAVNKIGEVLKQVLED